jgi:diacylglycerol kinase family enzyme
VNGRIFLNNSSIGFYPRVVKERERQRRQGRRKWLALAHAGALMFQQSRTLHVELDGDNTHQSYDTPFVFIGNNRYTVAGLDIGTRAALDGGKLWVCTAPYAGLKRKGAQTLCDMSWPRWQPKEQASTSASKRSSKLARSR